MIKRLVIVGLFTGSGHIATLLSLKFITKRIPQSTIAAIGEMDSLALLIVSIIGFGLQLSTTRELALSENWKDELRKAQSARLMLSIPIFLLGISGFLYFKNVLFFIAPFIALNADYALYGRGKSEMGAIMAFVRVSIPAATLVISSVFFSESIVYLFALGLTLSYFLTGFLVSKSLDVRYWIKPKLKYLKKYLDSFKIGIATFSLFFVGIGIINVVSYFYSDSVIAAAYISLKLYMIFKGVRRILVQSFFKDIKNDETALKIDYLASLAGMVFFGTFLFFPKTAILILFDDSALSYKSTFTILGAAGFISSFTTTSGTKLLLLKKDREYSINLVLGAIVAIGSGISFLYVFGDFPWVIGLCILLSELTISIANIKSLSIKGFMTKRVLLMLPLFGLCALAGGIKLLYSETIYTFGIFLLIFGAMAFIYSRRLNLNS